MGKYILEITGERKQETGPGSVRFGIGTGGGFETRTYSLDISKDDEAWPKAISIIQGIIDRLSDFRWERISSTRLFRLIYEDLHTNLGPTH